MPSQAQAPATTVSAWNHVRAVLLLPFMNTVLIPGLLLSFAGDYRIVSGAGGSGLLTLGLAIVLLGAGLVLVVRAIALFVRRGRGTLAPWDPTRALITSDIYRFSRNPMKAGLFLVLLAECVLLRSTALMIWAGCFIAVNAIYIRSFEEPGLRRRFGASYAVYCERVPRWLSARSLRRAGRVAERLS